MTHEEKHDETRAPSRWELLRDVAVFQGKLFIDGVRDVLLSPVSLGAAVLDFLGIGRRSGKHFYDVILFGRKTERWIDLFSAADHLEPSRFGDQRGGVDVLVKRLESMVVQEYERGKITKAAKDSIDKAIDRLQIRRDGGGQE
ncbi:MAG: hypothetical protein MJA83_05495 [Gammaproteobacteria bacterium]|nr:hypothetical protein [Gammaproteobacteria bacterium]